MDKHFTKLKAVTADSLCYMLEADMFDGGDRLTRALKRMQDDRALAIRTRIALIRAR